MYVMLYLRAEDDERVLDVWRAAWSGALEAVARHGGAVGHHHGIGAARAAQYGRSPDGLVHRRLKRAIDPDGVLFSRLLEDPSPDA
jgi:alkyldihydroxyacetonephosphate synthase